MNYTVRNGRVRWRLLAVLVVMLAAGLQGCGETPPVATPTVPAAGYFEPTYWPTQGWRTSTPEEQGVDSAQLESALRHMYDADINIRTLTVIRNGYVVMQAARQPYTLDMPVGVQSVTKSVTSALAGIAIHEGYIKDVHQKVLSFFPEMTIANRDANKEAITIEDLLAMQPGLDCADNTLNFAMEASKNWVEFALGLPMASPPGQKMIYCSPAPHILSAIIARTTGNSTAEYARTRLFEPLGIASTDWHWPIDPQGINIGGYGLTMKPDAMARLGLLYLSGGKWEGKQIIPQEWVAASSQVHSDPGDGRGYGYLFWLYPDHYAAEGLGEQKIQIVPDRNMVVVMTSAVDFHTGPVVTKLLQDYIIPAARSTGPLPANPTALKSLQERIAYMANPVEPVPALSETARRISGRTFLMDDNPQGWKTLTLAFHEGNPEALVTVVGLNGEQTMTQTVGVGLDNVYRVEQVEEGNFVGRRGKWTDENTFLASEVQSSLSLQEVETKAVVTGDSVNIRVMEVVFGNYVFTLTGKLEGTK